MGKAKKIRKYAEVKRMLNPKELQKWVFLYDASSAQLMLTEIKSLIALPLSVTCTRIGRCTEYRLSAGQSQ
jgi:hypothetical protein